MKRLLSMLTSIALLLASTSPALAAGTGFAPDGSMIAGSAAASLQTSHAAPAVASTAGISAPAVAATIAPIATLPPIFLSTDISGDFTDANMKLAVWLWLGRTGTPGSFTQADIDARLTVSTVFNCTNRGIGSLAGIEHMSGLTGMNCSLNSLTALPALPDTIEALDIGNNPITTIDSFPSALVTLYCRSIQTTSLPALPYDLDLLNCDLTPLDSLPNLPGGLKSLSCGGCGLSELPTLPSGLVSLSCPNNRLTTIAGLPDTVTWLDCRYNYLPDLDADLANVKTLYCSYNYLNAFTADIVPKVMFVEDLTMTPQYRTRFSGTGVSLVEGASRDMAADDFERSFSLDGAAWGVLDTVPAADFLYSTSDNAVVRVDSAGTLTAVSAGSANVTARYLGLSGEAVTTVIPVVVSAAGSGGSGAGSGGSGSGSGTGSGGSGGLDIDWLSASSWAVPELETAEALGLFTEKVTDRLQQDITREEFCGVVVKLYEGLSGKDADPVADNPFTDTSDSEILKAYALGIVKGVGTGKFAPDNRITRQEICVMLYRALKAADPSIDFGTSGVGVFADEGQIASWAIEAIRFASRNGIMKGTGGGKISPLANTSREQAIVLVKRTFETFD